MKTCKNCSTTKNFKDFYYDKRYPDDRYARCKECCRKKQRERYKANPQHYKQIQEKYIKANPRKRIDTIMRSQRGVSLEKYEILLEKQQGVCAVCKQIPVKRRLDIDHCHITGKIRGLLCNKCNQALGLLQDSIENINNLRKYLDKCV